MEVINEEFIEIKVEDTWGFTEQNYPRLLQVIEQSEPDFWEFLNPSPLLLYFRKRSRGEDRAKAVLGKISNLIKNDALYSETSVRSSAGVFLAQMEDSGKVNSIQRVGPAASK